MLLFVPLYWLWPSAEMLLTVQAVALGFAAVPLYLFARTQLANRQPHGARFRGHVQPHGATRFSGSWSHLQGELRWIFSLMEPPDFQGHGAISRRLAG
jgi:hypothetical protein